MKFGLTWIWICLTGFGISASDEMDMNVKGDEGKQVTITCIHGWASTNRKYFCRDPCEDRDVLVSSYRSYNWRFSLKDFRNGKFKVTITNLKTTDSGIYWCGVDRNGPDTFHKINLIVQKADIHTTRVSPNPVTKPQTSTSRSMTPTPDDITSSSAYTGPPVGLITGLVMMMIFGLVLCIGILNNFRDPEHHDAETITTCHIKPTYDITETPKQDDTFTVVYFTVSQSPPANSIQDNIKVDKHL